MEGLDAMRVNLPTYKAQLAQVDAQIAAGVVSDELVGVQKQLKELVDLLESTAPVAAAETGDGDSEGAQRGVGTQSKEETGASSAPVETRKPQDGSSAAPNAALLEPGSRVEVSTEDGAPARAATIQSRTDLGVYTVKFIGKKAGLPAAADVGASALRPLLFDGASASSSSPANADVAAWRAVEPAELAPGLRCEAWFSSDGNWYQAAVEQCPAPAVATVIYPEYGNRERVPIEHLRVAKDLPKDEAAGAGAKSAAASGVKAAAAASAGSAGGASSAGDSTSSQDGSAGAAAGGEAVAESSKEDGISSLGLSSLMREKIIAARKKRKAMESTQLREVPDALRIKSDDSELERKRKQRKVKAIKRHNNLAKKNLAAQKKVSSWQNFQAKATKKKKKSKGMMAVNKTSQFRTGDLKMDTMGTGNKAVKKRYY